MSHVLHMRESSSIACSGLPRKSLLCIRHDLPLARAWRRVSGGGHNSRSRAAHVRSLSPVWGVVAARAPEARAPHSGIARTLPRSARAAGRCSSPGRPPPGPAAVRRLMRLRHIDTQVSAASAVTHGRTTRVHASIRNLVLLPERSPGSSAASFRPRSSCCALVLQIDISSLFFDNPTICAIISYLIDLGGDKMKELFAAYALAAGIMIEVGAMSAGIRLAKLDNANLDLYGIEQTAPDSDRPEIVAQRRSIQEETDATMRNAFPTEA